jgi:hypothetical protein
MSFPLRRLVDKCGRVYANLKISNDKKNMGRSGKYYKKERPGIAISRCELM